ncbi:MAG: DUF4174 domain-containing protein [Pseudomonadota bacterium]
MGGLAALGLMLSLSVVDGARVDAALEAYRWSARPILVFAEPEDPRLDAQLDALDRARAALAERDNVVIVDTAERSALRRRFAPAGFTVILVGKDGGEKLRRRRVVKPAELNALIDTMPMRQNEMRSGGN